MMRAGSGTDDVDSLWQLLPESTLITALTSAWLKGQLVEGQLTKKK